MVVSSREASETLAVAEHWTVIVYDAIGRGQLAERLGNMIAGLISDSLRSGGRSVEVLLGDFPRGGSMHERLLVCMGLLFR